MSKDASATAMRIGASATVPEIRVSGKVEATTGGKAADDVATAIMIETGSDVAMIRHNGTIIAKDDGYDEGAPAVLDPSDPVAIVATPGAPNATGAKDADENKPT